MTDSTNIYLGIVKIIKEKLKNKNKLSLLASEYKKCIKHQKKSKNNQNMISLVIEF